MTRINYNKNIYFYDFRYRDDWENRKPGGNDDNVVNNSKLNALVSASSIETYFKTDAGTRKVEIELPGFVNLGLTGDKLVSSETSQIVDTTSDLITYEINLGTIRKIN
jgi:hypothetical protein